MKELIGSTIQAIWIDGDDQTYLAFDTDRGQFCYVAQGDCCSESWFYHIIGVGALLGHTVTQVEYVKNGDTPEDEYSRQEVDLLYGINIRTDGGMADIEFRNSSNGYYGGWLDLMEYLIPYSVRMVEVESDYIAQIGMP